MPSDSRVLPQRIILVRHAQSEGNVNQHTYTYLPDPQVPLVSGRSTRGKLLRVLRRTTAVSVPCCLGGRQHPSDTCCLLLPPAAVCQTALGREQAHEAGRTIRAHMDALHGSSDYSLYFYTSPYKRGLQTYEGIR